MTWLSVATSRHGFDGRGSQISRSAICFPGNQAFQERDLMVEEDEGLSLVPPRWKLKTVSRIPYDLRAQTHAGDGNTVYVTTKEKAAEISPTSP